MDELLEQLAAKEARVEQGGGAARQARQARLGRLTPRQRIEGLLDAGAPFTEIGRYALHRHKDAEDALAANRHPGDGVVCGIGDIHGRPTAVYAHDPTVLRGSMGLTGSKKVCHLLDLALQRGLPVVTLADSDGARILEGTDAIDAYGEVMRRTIALRERGLQITVASGLCVGAAAYTAALTDLVGMVAGQSFMFITGPKVTQAVTGEEVSIEALGGPELHATQTGACHAVLDDERSGLDWARDLLSYLSPGPTDDPPDRDTSKLAKRIPTAQRRAYDVRKVLAMVFDEGSVTELSPRFAGSLLTAFARLGGRSVAVLASQPLVHAGCLDIVSSRKGAWFVRLANKLGMPVVTLVDVPGYIPGLAQEAGGILPHGAELLAAYGEATVPKVCLVLRKSYGGASVLSFSADLRLALPTAEIAPMGVDAATLVTFGPPREDPEDAARREVFRAEWASHDGDVWTAAEAGFLDRVVSPAGVRRALCAAVEALSA